MTGRDWVTAALKKIGVLATGESLDAEEATDGLAEGNRLLSSWSTEGLMVHAITAESPLTLVAGDSTVTLGISGDITTRPVTIEQAVVRSGTTDYAPLVPLSAEQYAAIATKSSEGIPGFYFDDGGYPQRTLTLWPVPSSADSLLLWTRRALTQIATIDTSVSLPDGYEDALIYNLAVRLAPEYGRPVPDVIGLLAQETKQNLKRINQRPAYLRCDAIPTSSRAGGWYDISSGGYR
jgi:hypothetical protein